MTLKPRVQRFVTAYQQHGHASRAAVEAGYSEAGAGKAAWRLLQRPEVRAALAQPAVPPLELPSGVQLAFSYRGQPIPADVALILAGQGPSAAERRMWAAGLGMLALLAEEAAQLGTGDG